jgi:hypothetical protein
MLFYRPRNTNTGNMWDTWLFSHGNTFYLYYLANSAPDRLWDNISLACSKDGVRWKEIGPVIRKDGEHVTWMGTGTTWESPAAGLKKGHRKFQLNYSQFIGRKQTIFFAESDDLIHWEKCDAGTEFIQDIRWYESEGRWDTIHTFPNKKDGGLYGFWTASPKHGSKSRIGFGRSEDGVRWEALKPPEIQFDQEGELGGFARFNNRFYLLYGHNGNRMSFLFSDRFEGPYHFPEKNRILLNAGDSKHTYYARFFKLNNELLINHHSIAFTGVVYFGLIKKAVADSEGNIWAAWWDGNDRFKTNHSCHSYTETDFERNPAHPDLEISKTPLFSVCNRPDDMEFAPLAKKEGVLFPYGGTEYDLDSTDGALIEVNLELPKSIHHPKTGIYIPSQRDDTLSVLFDTKGRAEFIKSKKDLTGSILEFVMDRQYDFGSNPLLRIAANHSLIEVYLDDIFIESFSLSSEASGYIGLYNRMNSEIEVRCWGD